MCTTTTRSVQTDAERIVFLTPMDNGQGTKHPYPYCIVFSCFDIRFDSMCDRLSCGRGDGRRDSITAPRRSTHLVDVWARNNLCRHMAEGGHDPQFDVEVELDEEAMVMTCTSTSAFTNLGELECHLLLTPPRSSPWSFPADPFLAEKPSKREHKRSVHAVQKARVD